MNNMKLVYSKPDIQYWTAKELDSIEATMSGGGGYGGTVSMPSMSNCLANNFNFGEQTNGAAVVLEAFWDSINQAYSYKSMLYRNWIYFRALGDFVYSSVTLQGVPFSLVAGPYIGCDELFLNTLHMTDNAMFVVKNAVLFASSDDNDIEVDFAHMCIIVATHLAIELGLCPANALSSLGANTSQSIRDLSGWLGDSSIPSPSAISFPETDSNADMDAVNIAELAISDYSASQAIRSYYNDLTDNYRVQCFKNNTYITQSEYVEKIIFYQNLFGATPEYVLHYSMSDKINYLQDNFPEVYINFVSKL